MSKLDVFLWFTVKCNVCLVREQWKSKTKKKKVITHEKVVLKISN